MRAQLTANTGLLVLVLSSAAVAQEWTVDLHDISIDDPTVDRVRAEAVEFLPDGKTLVTAGLFYDGGTKKAVGEVRMLDAVDGSLTTTLRGTATTYALRAGSLTISPSGKRIAAAGHRSDQRQWIIDVFELDTTIKRRTLKGDPSPTTCVVFSPDQRLLAAAHRNGIVELWNPETGKLVSSFEAHPEGVWPIAFSPDGRFLATGNSDGSVTFFDPQEPRKLGHIPAQTDLSSLGSVAFSPDGTLLARGGFPKRQGNESPVDVWELQVTNDDDLKVISKRKATFQGHHEHTYSLVFSPNGKLLASANQDTTVRIWDVQTGNALPPIVQHKDFVYDVAFSPDGSRLATLGRDSLKLWTIEKLLDAD